MRSFLFTGAPFLLVLLAACGSNVVTQATAGAGAGSGSGASSTGAGAGTGTTTTNAAASTTGTGATTTSTSTTSTTTTNTTSTSSGGTGGGSVHGACHTSADCNGKPCQPLTPGGYLVCINPVAEATSCQSMGPPNECCTTADCPSGKACYPAGSIQACGGAFPNYNICLGDGCTSDADCVTPGGPAICAPAGAFGYPKRQCLRAYCRTDEDCTEKPGGACVPVGGDPCCSLLIPDGLACGYPGNCAADGCPSGQECTLAAPSGVACQQVSPCPP